MLEAQRVYPRLLRLLLCRCCCSAGAAALQVLLLCRCCCSAVSRQPIPRVVLYREWFWLAAGVDRSSPTRTIHATGSSGSAGDRGELDVGPAKLCRNGPDVHVLARHEKDACPHRSLTRPLDLHVLRRQQSASASQKTLLVERKASRRGAFMSTGRSQCACSCATREGRVPAPLAHATTRLARSAPPTASASASQNTLRRFSELSFSARSFLVSRTVPMYRSLTRLLGTFFAANSVCVGITEYAEKLLRVERSFSELNEASRRGAFMSAGRSRCTARSRDYSTFFATSSSS